MCLFQGNSMKIVIIENVVPLKGKYGVFDKLLMTSFSIVPTLQARQLAAITPKKHTVTVCNQRYNDIDYSTSYDVVVISFTTSTAYQAYTIADTFRSLSVPVVLTGMHASALPQEARDHADSILLGQGELQWLTLLSDVENKKLQPLYQHESYNNTCVIPSTQMQLPGFVVTGAIQATRGCPYHCSFCPESHLPGGHQFFARPIKDVINELKKIPQKTVIFYDASLTIDPEYTKELFSQMQGIGKHFFCNGNVDVLAKDPELVRLSKKAGCVSWLIGFETISQPTLDQIQKTTNTVNEYHQCVTNIHKHNMAVVGSFIFGFDNDTPDVFSSTLSLIQQLKIDVIDCSILTPFPGTPLFAELKRQNRILTQQWDAYTMKNVVFQPKNMTPKQLHQGVVWMYKQFYAPHRTTQRLIRAISFGLYPLLLVASRNTIALINSQALKKTEKKERVTEF